MGLDSLEEKLGNGILFSFQLPVEILQDHSNHLHESEKQRSEGHRSSVIAAGVHDKDISTVIVHVHVRVHGYSQYRAHERVEHGEARNVFRLAERPVVRGERTCHRHGGESDEPVEDPEQHEDLEDLQVDGEPARGEAICFCVIMFEKE